MTERYLLDTNIVSEATRLHPSLALTGWLQSQDDEALFISVLTLAELERGILEKAAGRRRRELESWFSGPDGPRAMFAGRVLSFDENSAVEWARIMAAGTKSGRSRSALDMIVAATAVASGLVVVTANARHFRDVGVTWLNPLTLERQ